MAQRQSGAGQQEDALSGGMAEPEVFETLAGAREASKACTRCPLYKPATQTVFGEGPGNARIMLVGEQPGDQEDLAGEPFVGPAGRVLDAGLAAAHIERDEVYVTNAVKHFKFEPRGKRRIHKKPSAGEILACRFWLSIERRLVQPQVIVAMGATAVTGLMRKSVSITSLRGRPVLLEDGTPMWVTVHPSFLLRMPDRDQAAIERRRFEDDLRSVRAFVDSLPGRHAA